MNIAPIAVQPSSAMVQSVVKGNCSVLIRSWSDRNGRGGTVSTLLSPKEERTLRVRLSVRPSHAFMMARIEKKDVSICT